ncbi:hypothetical protein JL720_15086 [Aureococcus anophagefferens]|nr:hypothetical protein JL720_15086 [Aureococcus anophagefferens]
MWFLLAGLLVAVGLAARFGLRRIQYLNPKEQLLVKLLTSKIVVNGPAVYFPPLFKTLSYKKRPRSRSRRRSTASSRRSARASSASSRAPARSPGPYEAAAAATESRSLSEAEGVVVLDRASGTRELSRARSRRRTPSTGEPLAAVALKAWEYSVIQARTARRVERGPALIRLGPEDVFLSARKTGATVDALHAALVRDRSTGAERLVTCERDASFVFVRRRAKIVEVRDLVRLAEHEAVILRDGSGKFHYRYGKTPDGCFFVTLAEFMASFNDLAKRASDGDDAFYRNRGIDVHSLEVTRYACADASTSAILAQIISETTNRMCRLSQQDSENEIALSKIDGAVAQEKGKAELNEIGARGVAAAGRGRS